MPWVSVICAAKSAASAWTASAASAAPTQRFSAPRLFPPGNFCSSPCFRNRRPSRTIRGFRCVLPDRPRRWTICAPIGCSVTLSSNGRRMARCFSSMSVPCLCPSSLLFVIFRRKNPCTRTAGTPGVPRGHRRIAASLLFGR